MPLVPLQTSDGDTVLTSDGDPVLVSVAPPSGLFGPGTIFVPSDDVINRGTLINIANGSLLSETINVLSGQLGAILSDGTFMVWHGASDVLNIYDTSFTLLHALTDPFGTGQSAQLFPIASDFESTFYITHTNVTAASVKSVSSVGVIVQTWTLDVPHVQGLGVSTDNTRLYYGDSANPRYVKGWNLIADTALGVIIDFGATGAIGFEILAVPDTTGDFLLSVQPDTGVDSWALRRYTSTGVQVWSTTIGAAAENEDICLALDLAAPTTFYWARLFFVSDPEISTFVQYRLSDGTEVQRFTELDGVSSGVPPSCPFFAWSGSRLTPDTRVIRRVRRFPLPSSPDNALTVMHNLEFLMKTGVGLIGASASGSPVLGQHPQIMMRISYDGGETWGNERWMSIGEIGDYVKRVKFYQIGQYRNGVCEIVFTDPVPIDLIDCFGSWDQGTH